MTSGSKAEPNCSTKILGYLGSCTGSAIEPFDMEVWGNKSRAVALFFLIRVELRGCSIMEQGAERHRQAVEVLRMGKSPISVGLRNTPLFAVMGAIVGIFIATIRHLFHDHQNMDSEELRWHFIPQMLVAMLVGATLLGGVSAIRSWRKRRRGYRDL
ncbi:hypothetical protein DC522_11755 [Microvirga sp. KLBC 81]|nr:hypothetical protein DC522_11755 [Microvirga sp. KLBC 81]